MHALPSLIAKPATRIELDFALKDLQFLAMTLITFDIQHK